MADQIVETVVVAVVKPAKLHPSSKDMVIEALTALNDRSGVSFSRIKKFIFEKYQSVHESYIQYLKMAMKKALNDGLIKNVKGVGLGGENLTTFFYRHSNLGSRHEICKFTP
jgi:hypothetical protein